MQVDRWNGQSLSRGQLPNIYGFTDVDGSQPDAWRYVVKVQDAGKPADAGATGKSLWQTCFFLKGLGEDLLCHFRFNRRFFRSAGESPEYNSSIVEQKKRWNHHLLEGR